MRLSSEEVLGLLVVALTLFSLAVAIASPAPALGGGGAGTPLPTPVPGWGRRNLSIPLLAPWAGTRAEGRIELGNATGLIVDLGAGKVTFEEGNEARVEYSGTGFRVSRSPEGTVNLSMGAGTVRVVLPPGAASLISVNLSMGEVSGRAPVGGPASVSIDVGMGDIELTVVVPGGSAVRANASVGWGEAELEGVNPIPTSPGRVLGELDGDESRLVEIGADVGMGSVLVTVERG